MALAGPIAEHIFCGKGHGLTGDYRRANSICLLWGLTEVECNAIQERVGEYVMLLECPIKALADRLESLMPDSVPDDEIDKFASFVDQSEAYVRRGGLLPGIEAHQTLRDAGLTIRGSDFSACPERIAPHEIDLDVFAKRLRELC